MKKTLAAMLIGVLLLVLLPAAAMASGAGAGIAVNDSNFPDANFRSYVAESCDTDRDGFLSADEIAAVTSIDVSRREIADLTGIEFFTALETLDCYDNYLTSLNVSANASLRWLNCCFNQLTSLDVSANAQLETLDCYDNYLTSLNVSSNASLRWLNCCFNQLTSLDLRANAALAELFCKNNQLTDLDVSANTNLYWFMCEGNHLTHLNLEHTQELSESEVSDQTVAIELEQKGGEYRLDFNSLVGAENIDRVTVIAVTPAGAQYTVRDGVLTSDTELTSISYSYSHGNTGYYLEPIDVTLLNISCIPMPEDTLAIDEHSFPDANFRRYIADRHDTNHDGFLSPEERMSVLSIDVTCTDIMNWEGMGIEDLTGIRHFPALTTLICSGNQLTNLDVSGCTFLTKLDCGRNMLTSLDVSGCPCLTRLDCSLNYDQLTSLDVSANPALIELNCADDYMTSLDVSGCPYLRYLNCYNTNLTSLDLSANPALTELYCDITPTGWNDPTDTP